eukprot:CAMPEP_0195518964 /NCGR_PEP_ID=MMETSP0794_2-20130614/14055_1 /TAXON_ID=515487 /ORGANISM="Stephanopyxis turris, Strain CCMP 815" /LENGTH=237 /DNA_ID=CAMNT_0040648025 /DNA_START=277 /DNA_END=990 /DNA_ORIENTATION=-
MESDMCKTLAKEGRCEAEPELMAKYCGRTFLEWGEAKQKRELHSQKRDAEHVKAGSPTFYDLSANIMKGEEIELEKFQGYITLVVFVPKACDGGVAAEHALQTLQDIRAIWPLVVEIVAFPYEHPDSHYYATQEDCSFDHFQMAFESRNSSAGGNGQSAQTSINAMEEISIHDNIEKGVKQHSVYKYFKDLLDFNIITGLSATVFLVSPDGDLVEAFYDGSATNIKDSIQKYVKQRL